LPTCGGASTQNWVAHGGYAVGPTAIAALALLECNVSPTDLSVQKAYTYVRTKATNLTYTYELSLALLFLDRFGKPADEPLIQEMALRLVAGQLTTGGWTYTCPVLSASDHGQLMTILAKNAPASILNVKPVDLNKLGPDNRVPVSALVKSLAVVQPPPAPDVKQLPGPSGDNSNTQFAILGLWAARRHKMPLDRSLALVLRRFRTSQKDDGSWDYMYPYGNRTTMSCVAGGLVGLAVGLGLTNDARADLSPVPATNDPGVKKGLGWVSTKIGNPTRRWNELPLYDTLWLWSVERVAMLYNLRTIHGKAWYPWGAEILVANQKPDGSWPGTWATESNADVSTSMALLFLVRANLAPDITEKLGLGE
jgi:hypothetical protein